MNIVAADWLPYALPFRQPWQSSRGAIDRRRGRLRRLQTDDGLSGWGDCAPLPEFGISEAAAAAFAETSARLDLAAQRAGLPLNAWLSGGPPLVGIAVNRNFGSVLNFDPGALNEAAAAGFSIVKFKLGLYPVAAEIFDLHRLARDLPATLQLRLDANRAWNLSDARRIVEACAGLPVEGLEEPLAEPDPVLLAGLQVKAGFPLAVDESVHLLDRAFFSQPPVRRIVVKPARHGGLPASVELAQRARAAGLEVIVTSGLESACGLLTCAHLAAAVAPHAVHGLATGEWFAEDTGPTPRIANGRLTLPDCSGLGYCPSATDRDAPAS